MVSGLNILQIEWHHLIAKNASIHNKCMFGTVFFSHEDLVVFFTKVTCPMRVDKHMAMIFGFLTSFWYIIFTKVPLKTWQKSLMSTQKKYVYSCHLEFCIKWSLKESGRWPLVGSQATSLRERVWGFLPPLHTPNYVMRLVYNKKKFSPLLYRGSKIWPIFRTIICVA